MPSQLPAVICTRTRLFGDGINNFLLITNTYYHLVNKGKNTFDVSMRNY
jgi:hypothetical protein